MNTKQKILIITLICISILLLIIWQQSTQTHTYTLTATPYNDYPSTYLPIAEWELLQMPKLITALDQPNTTITITQKQYQQIHNYLEADAEYLEFYGDYYYIELHQT